MFIICLKVMLHGTIRNEKKKCRNNVATLCCAKNRSCESSRVTSPLGKNILVKLNFLIAHKIVAP